MTEKDAPPEECRNENLEKAKADLEKAEAELEHAEHDVEKAVEEIKKAEHESERHEFKVTVLYDGVKKKFEVRLDETVKKLLDQAIKEFGPLPNPHTLSLFTEAGVELPDAQTIKEAGIKPHDELLLRPSKVKGGGH